MAKPNTPEELQAAVDAVNRHGGVTAAARAIGIPRTTLSARYAEAVNRSMNPSGEAPRDDLAAAKARITRLEADLKRASRESADAIEVKTAIGTLGMKLDECAAPRWTFIPPSASSPGVPTLLLSDLHWGEVVHPAQIGDVNIFNVQIAKRRLRYTIETAIHLLHILDPKMRYPGIVVPLGGDMISGNIHDELVATNELGSIPAMLDLYGDLVSAIGLLADALGKVFIPCVSGNHGRDTRKIWAKDRHHTSFDWLLYQFLAKHFASDKRVTFYVPDGPDAYYRIYDFRYLLTHGDQFRGGDGIIGPLGPIIRGDHKKRSRNAQINQDYDTMLCGHWHQLIMNSRTIVNGSLKGYDEYAFANNFPFEQPQQALWVTHPRYGITYRMPVYCEKRPLSLSTNWVEVKQK